MAAELVILYENLSIQRVLFTERNTVPRNRVMAMVIAHPEQPDNGLRLKRQQGAIGYDYYVLAYNSTQDMSFLGGYDRDEWGWWPMQRPWSTAEPWVMTDTKKPSWFPSNAMIFRGSTADVPGLWSSAEAIYYQSNGLMY